MQHSLQQSGFFRLITKLELQTLVPIFLAAWWIHFLSSLNSFRHAFCFKLSWTTTHLAYETAGTPQSAANCGNFLKRSWAFRTESITCSQIPTLNGGKQNIILSITLIFFNRSFERGYKETIVKGATEEKSQAGSHRYHLKQDGIASNPRSVFLWLIPWPHGFSLVFFLKKKKQQK